MHNLIQDSNNNVAKNGDRTMNSHIHFKISELDMIKIKEMMKKQSNKELQDCIEDIQTKRVKKFIGNDNHKAYLWMEMILLYEQEISTRRYDELTERYAVEK
jgi:hypothetical protein